MQNFYHVGVDLEYDDLESEIVNDKRYYVTPMGEKYPSVTTVTGLHSKKAIMDWRKRVGEEKANKISTQASARGTRVHNLCEKYLNNEMYYKQGCNVNDLGMFYKIKSILDNKITNIHALEVPLYSHHLRVAGRVDCIAEYDNKLSVIDFKTSTKEKKEHWIQNYFMQCSAYAVMYEEITKIPITELVIIIAVQEGNAQVFTKKRDDYIKDFISYRKLFDELYLQKT
tara:strand:+ start:3450 stop:4130 length:681 start_codon:yes stop_codon:yes gene_type:complete